MTSVEYTPLSSALVIRLLEVKNRLLVAMDYSTTELLDGSEPDEAFRNKEAEKHVQFTNVTIAQACSMYDSISRIISNGKIRTDVLDAFNTNTSLFNLEFASTNPDKNEEFLAYTEHNVLFNAISPLFSIIPIDHEKLDVLEGVDSFSHNASLKSAAYSNQRTNCLVLAEDSGISVPTFTLDSETADYLIPGVVSARLATPKVLKRIATDMQQYYPQTADIEGFREADASQTQINNMVLLDMLSGLPEGDRSTAILNTFASLALKGTELSSGNGSLVGYVSVDNLPLIDPLAAVDGFGYNPIFYVPTLGVYLEDINVRVRARFDHRSQAFGTVFDNFFKLLSNVQK